MISIESHSKQIKLLNEYIVALEKQIAAARKEAEEQQKGANNQVEDMRLMNEDINKLRNQNAQLKFNLGRQDQTIRRLIPFEKQYGNVRQQLQKGAAEFNKLLLQFQQSQQNNKSLDEKCQSLDLELKKRTESFVEASQRNQQQIQELKRNVGQKEKQRDEVINQLNIEKRNSSARIASLEQTRDEILRIKNDAINKLNKDVEELKLKYNKDMTSNSQTRNNLGEQIKQLITSSNQTKNQLIATKKDLTQTKQLLQKKTAQFDDLTSKFKAKTNQYDKLSKTSNEQKIVLIRNIQRLQEEKIKLETLNNACKGNISQTTKTLGDSLKRSEQLSKKLFEANQEISIHKDTIAKNQTQIKGLTTSLSEANKQILKKNEEAKVRQEYILSLKGDIDAAKREIESLQQLKSNNLSNIGQLDQKTNRLRGQLADRNKQLQQKNAMIEENRILIAKKNSEIQDLEIIKKDHQSLIARLNSDLQNSNQAIQNLKTIKQQLETYLENHKVKISQLEDKASKLNSELEVTKQQKSQIEKQKEDLSKRQSQILQEKLGDKDLLTRQISSRDKKIQQLTERYEKLQSLSTNQSRNSSQTIKKLEAQKNSQNIIINQSNIQIESLKKKIEQLQANLAKTKEMLDSTIQEYSTYRKKKETENEQLSNQLKESEKKNEKRAAKIQELNQEISVLENTHSSQRKNLGDSQKEEIERQKAKFKQSILQLKNQNEEAINKKNVQIDQLRQLIQKNSQQSEKNLKAIRDQFSAKQKSLTDSIKSLQIENKNLEKEVRRLNFATISQTQSKSSKQFEIETLRRSMQKMEAYSKQQKNTIQQLNRLLQSKAAELQSLQSSNAMLRKQVIAALNNEQSSRKELLQTKSKVNSILINSNSRNSLRDFATSSKIQPANARSSVIQQKKKKSTFTNKESIDISTSSKVRPKEKQKTLAGDKLKESLVEDLSESNFNDILKEIQATKD